MSYFWSEMEMKLFCLLVMGFFLLLQAKNPQAHRSRMQAVYICTVLGIVLSAFGDVAATFSGQALQNVRHVAAGLCCALTAYFWWRYALAVKQRNITARAAVNGVLASAAIGAAAYFVSLCGSNAAVYASVFAVTVVFTVSQYNKIRVDNLTKLYNRYGMDAEIREQLQQYARDRNDSFYIIACDLDNFKHINDTWGHQEGDRALILIAAALLKVGKMFDAEVFRIGGDEFVIITDTSEEGLANRVTDAIKRELDQIDFRDDFDIRMSMGIALYDGVTPVDALLNNADKKLYEAKKINKTETA